MSEGYNTRQKSQKQEMYDLLSVIVPVYNGEKYLMNLVREIENQSYPNIEIVIVDDGSTDSTPYLCDKIRNDYSNIVIIKQENKGPSKAREKGVKESSGKYVSFVDVDDRVDKRCFSTAIAEMINQQCDIVQFGCRLVDKNMNDIVEDNIYHEVIEGSEKCFESFISQKNVTNYLVNKVYLRAIFSDIEWPDLFYSEDYCVLAQLYGKAKKVCTIEDKMYFYYQNDQSATRQPFSIKRLDEIKAGKFVLEYAKRNYTHYMPECYNYICSHSSRLYEIVFFSSINNKKRVKRYLRGVFDIYFRRMKYSLKIENRSLFFDNYTVVFSISPLAAVLIKCFKEKMKAVLFVL